MKRCPTCKREFEDSITYCPDDGSPLVTQSRPDSDETLVTRSIRDRDIPTTQYGQLGGKATVSGSIADLPGLPPYAATPAKRKVWPWVVAGVAILFLFGIVIAAVIAIPKNRQQAKSRRGDRIAVIFRSGYTDTVRAQFRHRRPDRRESRIVTVD